MTDILCNWLNNDVKLSRKVEPTSFAREFSSGLLVGEVLCKYQLQDDFDQFSQSRTADAKLNNFTRLEPVLHLLGIPFDTNTARDMMTEKHGTATRLMYQLFIALNKKQKNNLTGVAMETMRPAAPAKLDGVESLMYKERLKHLTPRQTDLNLDALVGKFHEKQIEMEQHAFKERFEEQERHQRALQEERQALIHKYQENKAKQSEMLARINSSSVASVSERPQTRDRAATVEIPKTPPSKTVKAISLRQEARKQVEAEYMIKDIAAFEEKLNRTLPPPKPFGSAEIKAHVETEAQQAKAEVMALPDNLDLIKPASNNDYISKIRKRLNEDASARAEREKRRRKVLVDQLKAHEAQEEARREEMLVNCLMRQSQQERRIAVQLLQARHEKDVIRNNRLMREKQNEQRRLRDFEEALNREAEISRLAKLEYMEQTRQDQELHEKIAKERAVARYEKHYSMCSEITDSITDFAAKVGEYRELTNKLLPPKLVRQWKLLFTEGKPLYEQADEVQEVPEEPTPEQVLEQERQALLDEGDFNEYRNMIGEWQPPSETEIKGPPSNNPIVGHIVHRLFNLVHPPSPPPPPPEFPAFPIKACVLGKVFSGKSSCVSKLAQSHRLQVLNIEVLINEAIEAHKQGETISEEEELGGKMSKDSLPATAESGRQPVPLTAEEDRANTQMSDTTAGQQEVDNKEAEAPATLSKPEEGAEKMDPEKPVEEGTEDSLLLSDRVKTKSNSVPARQLSPAKQPRKPKSSPRARLGAKAMKCLKRGKPVDDALNIEIVVEAIRRLPEGTGWVMDGFPSTYSQAKLLEKALSGFEAQSRESSRLSLAGKDKGKLKKSQLAPDPSPAPPAPEPPSGINVVVLLDISDELCLKRSAGRTYAAQSDLQYQQEFKPPPEGSATGIGKVEKVIPVEDAAHDMEQIQHRITSFQDSWPKLEKWFTKFGSLKKVDATQPEETVYLEVENILEETMNKLEGKGQEETVITETETEEKPPEPEPKPEPSPPVPPPETVKEEGRSRPTSKTGSRAGSGKRSGSRGSKGSKDSKSPKRGSKSGKSPKGSRGSSPKSPKRGKSGKKSKSPTPVPEPEPEVPKEPAGPLPGSDEWQYVDEPIDDELARILAPHWEAIENTYVNASKNVFRNLRTERENIYRYFYEIRQDFLSYLKRPDNKQEFITQWQKEYNQVPDDMRDDEETRQELHQQVDDLRERLWSICDERKENAEKERLAVIGDGWMEDRLGLLCNHYITLMQGEVDRFQDTTHLLNDYYRGMEGKIPNELQPEFIRIPLVELPVMEDEVEQTGQGSQVRVETPTAEAAEEGQDPRSPGSKSVTPTGKKKSKMDVGEDTEGEAEQKKQRIPLVPRRPVSPDSGAAGAKGAKPDKAKAKKDTVGEIPEGTEPPTDLDEKLVFDAYVMAIMSVDRLVAAEKAAKEAEEEAEREKEREKEREREKQAAAAKPKKGGKKGAKSRSPSPKKGKGKEQEPEPTPVTRQGRAVEEVSEEEKEKKKVKERMRMEFFAAIEKEASATKQRIELVKLISGVVLQTLKSLAQKTYDEMNDWLGARFLKEMEGIDHLSELMRNAIEKGERIREQMVLEQESFLVDEDVKVLRSPSPEPQPSPVEQPMPDALTVTQLMNIYEQFKLTAPSGVMSVRAFQETFHDMTQLTHGTEEIPHMWLSLTQAQVEAIGNTFSADGEFVDWRTFLLAAAQPWQIPTQTELLEALQRLKDMDQKNTGYITREQFQQVELWFRPESKPGSPHNRDESDQFNRIEHFKKSLFNLFADFNCDPPQLNYVNMLMYFAADLDPYEGFLRALSVAAGTHMPRIPRKPSGRPVSQASLTVSEDLDKERLLEPLSAPDDIPESAKDALVPIEALYQVLRHGHSRHGDGQRFRTSTDPEETYQKEKLAGVYQELGSEDLHPVPLLVLLEHPVIQDMVVMVTTFKLTDLRTLMASLMTTDNTDTHSTKTLE